MTTDEEATLRAELNGARQAEAACRRERDEARMCLKAETEHRLFAVESTRRAEAERDEAHKAGYDNGWFDATKRISDGLKAGPGHYPGGEHSALRAAIERDHERVRSEARRAALEEAARILEMEGWDRADEVPGLVRALAATSSGGR